MNALESRKRQLADSDPDRPEKKLAVTQNQNRGLIKVGRLNWDQAKHRDVIVQCPGYRPVVIKNYTSGLGWQLSPYFLKNERDHIHENIWQFSKVWERVYPQSQKCGWNYKSEVHVKSGVIQPEYWAWRSRGFEHSNAVRYPNGFRNRTKVLYSLQEDDIETKLGYVEARAKIYAAEYENLALKENAYFELQSLIDRGENLLLLDVDGPIYNSTQNPLLFKDS